MDTKTMVPAALCALLRAAVAAAQVAGPEGMTKGMNYVRASSTYSYNSLPSYQSLGDGGAISVERDGRCR